MGESTPICRCRVLYLGSAVPRQSKDGLQGIQEPLRNLYPAGGVVAARGIDSWLSVWSNGILLENVDENLKQITRFFPIESLHYCAAVRQVLIPERVNSSPEPKFLPLDSPFARMPQAQHPPIFAAILRRTTGIKVLECHVFICKREAAANALVRCCFHAYADNSYARQLETGSIDAGAGSSLYGTLNSAIGDSKSNGGLTRVELANDSGPGTLIRSRMGSTTTLNSVGRAVHSLTSNGVGAGGLSMNGGGSNGSAADGYTSVKNFYGSSADLNILTNNGDTPFFYGDENHKIWNGSHDQLDKCVLESPYEVFSGNSSTLNRPTRVRQMSVPIEVQPPPAKEDKKKVKKSSKPSGCQSLSGTLLRTKPMATATLNRPGPICGPEYETSDITANLRHYHTISHRSLPPAPLGMQSPNRLISGHVPYAHMPLAMQIPLVIPQSTRSAKKKKKGKKHSKVLVDMPFVQPLYTIHQPTLPQSATAKSLIGEPRPLAALNRKLVASMGNGLDDSGNSGPESPVGTGIYRRKGHLNELAFSFSIRQEHRSRSHGSLASLQFSPPNMKKEREIEQMVAGLDLKDHDSINLDTTTLQRKNPHITAGYHYQLHHQHEDVDDTSKPVPFYGNDMNRSKNASKPRR